MSEAKLADLREGDVVRVSYQVAVLNGPDSDGDVRIHEPGSGDRGYLMANEMEALEATFELVSREGKFKVGDQVLDGAGDPGVVVQIDYAGRPGEPYRVYDPREDEALWWGEDDLQAAVAE